MSKVNPFGPWGTHAYPQAAFPLSGQGNQFLITCYPPHVGIHLLHDTQLPTTTHAQVFRCVEPGYGSSIKIGPTYLPLPQAMYHKVINELLAQGVYEDQKHGR